MTCSLDGCDRRAHSRGWCITHYARWRRTGSTELTARVAAQCSVEGCESPNYSKGMCRIHYVRLRTKGTVELEPVFTTAERFAGYYQPNENGCWIWAGKPGLNGYGRISISNTLHYAHRVAYELNVGPIPEGLTIDHLCRVRMCVNPAHLETVTLAENTRREMSARRAS